MVHSPQSRGGRISEQRGGRMCRYQVALPPLHIVFFNSSKPGGRPGASTHLACQCCAQPHSDRGKSNPSSALIQRGCGCGTLLYSWGALAPPSLVPLRERLCLTNSSPPQAPGSLWWAEGTDRSPGRPPGQPPSLVLWWVHSWHSPPSSAQTRELGHGRKCAIQGKSLQDFPNCADVSEPHSTPLPTPYPLAQEPHGPSPSTQSSPEGPTLRWWSQKPPQGALSVPRARDVSGGEGLERSQPWYREVGRAGRESGGTLRLWNGVQSTS